jgi:YceI-like domain
VLEGIEAALPVKSIGTGMGLRDSHMRKYVFTTGDGKVPDLRFSADKAVCSKGEGRQSTCELAGNLEIRGTARPFTVVLKVSEDGDTLRAVDDSDRLHRLRLLSHLAAGRRAAERVRARHRRSTEPSRAITSRRLKGV